MDARDLAAALADPIQSLGAAFYFAEGTRESASALGLNVYQFYGLGRAGVMGDVEPAVVESVFAFFHPGVIDLIYTQPRTSHDPVTTAAAHLASTNAFADQSFAGVAPGALADVARVAREVLDGVEVGRYPLVDGYYRSWDESYDACHAAYRAVIALRELRGAVHVEAVSRAGLTPLEACYLQDPGVFALHGYAESDAPSVTADLTTRKERAEALTDEAMAHYLEPLGDDARAALLEGVRAMAASLADPAAAR